MRNIGGQALAEAFLLRQRLGQMIDGGHHFLQLAGIGRAFKSNSVIPL